MLTRWKDVREIYKTTGSDVKNRVKELWQPIETVLVLENVPQSETQEIKTFFLESMGETQDGLSEDEQKLFDTLKDMLKEKGRDVLTVTDIAMKLKPEYINMDDKEKKKLQSWIGKSVKTLNLYDKKAGRKKNQRAYEFCFEHVKSVYFKFSTENDNYSGIVASQIDKPLHSKDIQTDHYLKGVVAGSGYSGIGGHGNCQENATQTPLDHYMPLSATSQKTIGHIPNQFNNKDLYDNIATMPPKTEENKNKNTTVDVSNEEILEEVE